MDVEFCQKLFCIYWDNNAIFILDFVDVVCHIDWFANNELFLHPWNKFHLIMCMVFFIFCWFSWLIFCWGFSHLYSLTDSFTIFYRTFVLFWYQHDGGLIGWFWNFIHPNLLISSSLSSLLALTVYSILLWFFVSLLYCLLWFSGFFSYFVYLWPLFFVFSWWA